MKALPKPEHHGMVFVKTHPTGEDELYCPTCGRRVLIKWPPSYKKVVLETGDEYAIHSGGKGGLDMGAPQVNQGSDITEQDSERLADWEGWLGQMDFDGLWHRKI